MNLSNDLANLSYNRSNLINGIAHIGVGGFHRSHQAFYIHELLKLGKGSDWTITGIGMRKPDAKIEKILREQDFLYSLIIRHPNQIIETEVIGSITEFIPAYENIQLAIDKLASPDTKIVSLTITEGGYAYSEDEINQLDQPKTVFGLIISALKRRMNNNLSGFTILSCDNIQHNGDLTKKLFLSFAEKIDSKLFNWMKTSVSFPNTMVDRITPISTEEDINYILEKKGYLDQWPVTCEPFIQWVVEDNFVNGRPSLEEVGVQFVSDVKPYEKMKLRLLNAGHSVLGIPGAIHGYETINDCMQDFIFSKFMRSFMDEEATPTLDAVSGVDLEAYKDKIQERFANPNIKDSVARICSESSAKLPKFLIETLAENIQQNRSIKFISLVLAAFSYYHDKQIDQNGNSLIIIDEMKDELHQKANSILEIESIFGNISQSSRFMETYKNHLEKLYLTNDIRMIMEEMI